MERFKSLFKAFEQLFKAYKQVFKAYKQLFKGFEQTFDAEHSGLWRQYSDFFVRRFVLRVC